MTNVKELYKKYMDNMPDDINEKKDIKEYVIMLFGKSRRRIWMKNIVC
jgi:hypothetical protein